jgi:hypothetical protein
MVHDGDQQAIAPSGDDFARVRTLAPALAVQDINAPRDDDAIHRPLIERFRELEHLPQGGVDEGGSPAGPSDSEIKYQGLMMPCPSKTEVASVRDLSGHALAAGFRTAYGILVQMRVRPDGRNWDGVKISESLTPGSTTCPDTLTRGDPCSGSSTFTVGGSSGRSSVAPAQPGARNRFWDYHTTHVRPPGVSVLHDPSRNPAGLATCATTCNQEYKCDGKVIGSHTVTRSYRKGDYHGSSVTFVDVTKSK